MRTYITRGEIISRMLASVISISSYKGEISDRTLVTIQIHANKLILIGLFLHDSE